MPAPLATLFNLAPAVEKALKARFSAQLPSVPAFRQRETADLPAQRLEIKFITGPDTGRIHRLPDGTFRPDSWAFTLGIALATVRVKDRPDAHGFLTARVREIVASARYDDFFLPHHVLCQLTEQHGSESCRQLDDSDMSDLTWTGIIGIRTSAWPPG